MLTLAVFGLFTDVITNSEFVVSYSNRDTDIEIVKVAVIFLAEVFHLKQPFYPTSGNETRSLNIYVTSD